MLPIELYFSLLFFTTIYTYLIKLLFQHFPSETIFNPLIFICFGFSFALSTIISLFIIKERIYAYKTKNSYKKWKFPNHKLALAYVNSNDRYIQASDNKKNLLASLLFFSWIIENDLNLENIILQRGKEIKIINLKEGSN